MKKLCALLLVLLMAFGVLAGCDKKAGEPEVQTTPAPVDLSEPVTITIAGAWADCKAIEAVGAMFKTEYSNCTVVYECVDDYYNNLVKRMDGEEAIDLFFVPGIQSSSEESSVLLPYALDLKSAEGLDLSQTYAPLVESALFREDTTKLYSIPLGAEMRGMYVNKTLLSSVGINSVPKNQAELLAACATLKAAGYIPMQGNPDYFAQWLIMPWVFNSIANAADPTAAHNAVETRNAEETAVLLREPLEFLYNLASNYYYDYKTAQLSLNLFNDSTEEDHARYFFNVVKENETYAKKDDTAGQVAFMPAPLSYRNTMDKVKQDYASSIEYEFIPAPVGVNGGYVYLSPAHSIAANKNSDKLEWTVRFLNYLFSAEANELFAEDFNVMPNVQGVFDYASSMFAVPQNQISHLGQVTFTWGFYEAFKNVAVQTAKANKPDTITENGGVMYSFEHYIEMLKTEVTPSAS